jgi:transposase-like protein
MHWYHNISRLDLSVKPCSTMPPRRKLSVEDRVRALGMLQRNTSMREVARQLGVSHSVISRLWHRHLATGRLQDRPRRIDPALDAQRRQPEGKIATSRARSYRTGLPLQASADNSWGRTLTSTSVGRPFGIVFMQQTSWVIAQQWKASWHLTRENYIKLTRESLPLWDS